MLADLKLGPAYDGFLFLAESARNPPYLKSHRHREMELNLVVRGHITLVACGRRYTFRQRDLLWLYPAQEHQLVDRSPDAQYYVAVFKPEMIAWSCRGEGYAGLRRDSPEAGEDALLHTALDPETFDLVRRNMGTVTEGGLDPDLLNREGGYGVESDFRFEHGDPDGLNAGLHHLLLLCWRCQRTGHGLRASPTALHPAVQKALALLSSEDAAAAGEDEALDKLAARCGVSATYLSRVFARQVGVPLSRYRNSARLARFWKHYRGPRQPSISEAMFAAGFGSYAQFYKVFTQAYGRGPRESLRL